MSFYAKLEAKNSIHEDMTVRNLFYLVAKTLVILVAVNSYSQSASAEWEFKLAPLFLWGISIDGDASIGTTVAPLDLQFKDDVFSCSSRRT